MKVSGSSDHSGHSDDFHDPEVKALTSPTHGELSDTLRKQHLQDDEEMSNRGDDNEDPELEVFEGVVEGGHADWEALERLLSPEREESICSNQLSAELTRTLRRTSQSKISETAGPGSMLSPSLCFGQTGQIGGESSLSIGDVASEASSITSGEIESDSERVLPRSNSVTMMLQNSAIRAQYHNDAIKV